MEKKQQLFPGPLRWSFFCVAVPLTLLIVVTYASPEGDAEVGTIGFRLSRSVIQIETKIYRKSLQLSSCAC